MSGTNAAPNPDPRFLALPTNRLLFAEIFMTPASVYAVLVDAPEPSNSATKNGE
jgi:hypothetical protein